MSVDLIVEDPRWDTLGLAQLAETAVQAALTHLPDGWEVAILACDDSRIADLNAEFRAKPKATNVLSWPSEERANPGNTPAPPQDLELGDIAIAYDTCAREAMDQSKPLETHVTHLIVHGVLHLLGFDHESDADAQIMETLEVEVLGKLGIDNPYIIK